jgi:hypothetical protein
MVDISKTADQVRSDPILDAVREPRMTGSVFSSERENRRVCGIPMLSRTDSIALAGERVNEVKEQSIMERRTRFGKMNN